MFLISKGLSLEPSESYYNRSSTVADIRTEANFLDHAIAMGNIPIASFLLSVGERPRKTRFSDTHYHNPNIDKIVTRASLHPSSLKICAG